MAMLAVLPWFAAMASGVNVEITSAGVIRRQGTANAQGVPSKEGHKAADANLADNTENDFSDRVICRLVLHADQNCRRSNSHSITLTDYNQGRMCWDDGSCNSWEGFGNIWRTSSIEVSGWNCPLDAMIIDDDYGNILDKPQNVIVKQGECFNLPSDLLNDIYGVLWGHWG